MRRYIAIRGLSRAGAESGWGVIEEALEEERGMERSRCGRRALRSI